MTNKQRKVLIGMFPNGVVTFRSYRVGYLPYIEKPPWFVPDRSRVKVNGRVVLNLIKAGYLKFEPDWPGKYVAVLTEKSRDFLRDIFYERLQHTNQGQE